ncbi:hypothetical protein FISHEDRAFT_78920 [Fistulina hepatica ATCC 64428]|uniref:Uncharacterized protein n=1 Tax=Fistulina hepatica ATCC 64428 TaxID=1128425 RepID=A0A0D7A0U3_9AGAR|nr:hypothetical protein FISHEDRAFT_78920 [Fistulina hepatica ATCC 64428]
MSVATVTEPLWFLVLYLANMPRAPAPLQAHATSPALMITKPFAPRESTGLPTMQVIKETIESGRWRATPETLRQMDELHIKMRKYVETSHSLREQMRTDPHDPSVADEKRFSRAVSCLNDIDENDAVPERRITAMQMNDYVTFYQYCWIRFYLKFQLHHVDNEWPRPDVKLDLWQIPWPIINVDEAIRDEWKYSTLVVVTSPGDITYERVKAFLDHPHRPHGLRGLSTAAAAEAELPRFTYETMTACILPLLPADNVLATRVMKCFERVKEILRSLAHSR